MSMVGTLEVEEVEVSLRRFLMVANVDVIGVFVESRLTVVRFGMMGI